MFDWIKPANHEGTHYLQGYNGTLNFDKQQYQKWIGLKPWATNLILDGEATTQMGAPALVKFSIAMSKEKAPFYPVTLLDCYDAISDKCSWCNL